MGARGVCDFGLAIVKGLVERNDGTVYFGSLMGYADHAHQACLRGLIEPASYEQEGTAWRLTAKGSETYAARNLGALPRNGRAYGWDWSITEVAP